MNTLAVFRREWLGRRNLFLVAGLQGLLLLLMAWLGRGRGREFHEGLGFAAVFGGILFAWGTAALYGATMIGKDVEERRFGFFLNRPLHVAEIFGGKLGAGLLLSVAAGSLLSLPLILFEGGLRQMALKDAAGLLGFMATGSLFLLLLLHGLSIQVRSRSAWLLLDLAVWLNFLGGSYLLLRHLMGAGAWNGMTRLMLGLLALATLALALSAYMQVARGRVDLRRSHRALSLALAAGLGASLLGGWAYSAWYLDVKAGDLREAQVLLGPAKGDWFLVVGRARGRGGDRFALLMNARNGASLRVGLADALLNAFNGENLMRNAADATISRDGSRAAWVDWKLYESEEPGFPLMTADLREAAPRPRRVTLPATGISPQSCRLVLSEDGQRLAICSDSDYLVVELPSGKEVASGKHGKPFFFEGAFVGQAKFRMVYGLHGRSDLRVRAAIRELDLTRGTWRESAAPDALGDWNVSKWDAQGDRLLVWARQGPVGGGMAVSRLGDGMGERMLRDLGPATTLWGLQFLEDGRIVQGDKATAGLRLLDRDGREVWKLELGSGWSHLTPCGQLPDGRLLVEAQDQGGGPQLFAVDLATRKVDLVARDLRAIHPGHQGRDGAISPAVLGSRLFRSAAGDLVLEDFQGPRRVVIPAWHLSAPER